MYPAVSVQGTRVPDTLSTAAGVTFDPLDPATNVDFRLGRSVCLGTVPRQIQLAASTCCLYKFGCQSSLHQTPVYLSVLYVDIFSVVQYVSMVWIFLSVFKVVLVRNPLSALFRSVCSGTVPRLRHGAPGFSDGLELHPIPLRRVRSDVITGPGEG